MINNPMLNCRKLSKNFHGQSVFEEVDFSINRGEIIALLGPSGCGKTTLLRCLAGLEQLSQGQVHLENKDITSQPTELRPIVMMFQQPLLFPHMNVLENVAYSLKFKDKDKKSRNLIAKEFLSLVEMQDFSKRYPFELSGGQQQRVALARALVTRPQLLLLDEPFSSLDPELREVIRSWLLRLIKSEGVTALFVTHDKEEAMIMGDRVAILIDGVLQQIGSPMEVYCKPRNKTVAKFFCDGLFLNEKVFLPANKINIEHSVDLAIQDGAIAFEAEILSKWIKTGQYGYRLRVDSIAQEIALFVNKDFEINEKVMLSFMEKDKYFFE